jgi:Zn-dependent membrane protease YugP
MFAIIPFDPLYFIILAPGMLLALWAQAKVKSTYAAASEVPVRTGVSGASAARRILDNHGLHDVAIEPSPGGTLSDHFDPRHNVLRLSGPVYQGRSLAAVGIAAHEAGHAIQQATSYGPLAIRNGLVPLAATGSSLSMGIFVIGLVLSWMGSTSIGPTLIIGAIVLFSIGVLFQLINLPVEFDASRRALHALNESGIVSTAEVEPVRKVLSAAAMTYVAATLTAILTLLYLLLRSGLLGGGRSD